MVLEYLNSVFKEPGRKYNLIYLCPPQWTTPTSGFGSEKWKLVITGPAIFPGTLQSFDANLSLGKSLLTIGSHSNVSNLQDSI